MLTEGESFVDMGSPPSRVCHPRCRPGDGAIPARDNPTAALSLAMLTYGREAGLVLYGFGLM